MKKLNITVLLSVILAAAGCNPSDNSSATEEESASETTEAQSVADAAHNSQNALDWAGV